MASNVNINVNIHQNLGRYNHCRYPRQRLIAFTVVYKQSLALIMFLKCLRTYRPRSTVHVTNRFGIEDGIVSLKFNRPLTTNTEVAAID